MAEIIRGTYDGHHGVFTSLSDDAVLWRYLDLTKLLALLEDNALHFARADLLGDPFEGSEAALNSEPPTHVFNVDRQELEELDGEGRDRFRKIYEMMRPHRIAQRRWIWISCWNHSPIESDALWGRYVRAEYGVAIRSTFGRLTRSFGDPLPPQAERSQEPLPTDAPWPVYVGQVAYVDYATAAWPHGNAFWPYVHKRLSFEHEHEVRALVTRMPTIEVDGEQRVEREADMPPGRLVAVDLGVLIESIHVSPVAPEWFSDLVRRVCARYGVAADVHQSELAATPIF